MGETIITAVTSGGFEFTADIEVLQDMEFIEILGEVDTNSILLPKLCEMLVGKDGKKRLYDFVRNENGRALVSNIQPIAIEIMQILSDRSKEVKNS